MGFYYEGGNVMDVLRAETWDYNLYKWRVGGCTVFKEDGLEIAKVKERNWEFGELKNENVKLESHWKRLETSSLLEYKPFYQRLHILATILVNLCMARTSKNIHL